ncbi:MAG: hypothetical protein ACJATK_001226 [Paracoccaceae bacterium]|jgi:hypothetical protein
MKQPRPNPVGHGYNQSSAEYRGQLPNRDVVDLFTIRELLHEFFRAVFWELIVYI